MLKANLYVDRIDLSPYLTREECNLLGGPDCTQIAARLKDGSLALEDCLALSPARRQALTLAVRALEFLPVVQSLELPRPVPPDLFEINDPAPDSPLLVTGNSEFTLAVVTGLLAHTVSPFYLLLVDTRGDTVDMSMIYRSFTPQRLDQGLEAHRLVEKLNRRQLIIPGVVGPLKEELASYTGWDIRVGPICVAELPLFLGETYWQPPAET
jgi:CO dehydrogenase/acetyl-CoA synthase gamma subunit (corrinoid Fe-S protein)